MTLKKAKEYMVEHPGTKFICQVFHDEWIMYDAEKNKFVFEDGYEPDVYWWLTAMSWDYDWWILDEHR